MRQSSLYMILNFMVKEVSWWHLRSCAQNSLCSLPHRLRVPTQEIGDSMNTYIHDLIRLDFKARQFADEARENDKDIREGGMC